MNVYKNKPILFYKSSKEIGQNRTPQSVICCLVLGMGHLKHHIYVAGKKVSKHLEEYLYHIFLSIYAASEREYRIHRQFDCGFSHQTVEWTDDYHEEND